MICSPFGGIPRNWKPLSQALPFLLGKVVPPSGGSLEIGNIGVPLWCGPPKAWVFPLRGDP